MFLVNITSFNDVLINFMGHLSRLVGVILNAKMSTCCYLQLISLKMSIFLCQTGIPSTNVTFIAQNCSTKLGFNSLDALHQI